MRLIVNYWCNLLPGYLVSNTVAWKDLCCSFIFSQQNSLDSLFQAYGNFQEATCSWKANVHAFYCQRPFLCHFKVNNKFFWIFHSMERFTKVVTLSFVTFSSSSTSSCRIECQRSLDVPTQVLCITWHDCFTKKLHRTAEWLCFWMKAYATVMQLYFWIKAYELSLKGSELWHAYLSPWCKSKDGKDWQKKKWKYSIHTIDKNSTTMLPTCEWIITLIKLVWETFPANDLFYDQVWAHFLEI